MEKKKKTPVSKTSELTTPKLTPEELAGFQADDQRIRDMSLLAVLDKSLPALPKDHMFKMRERRDVELAFHATFELLGGVPAMFHWAYENKEEFYKQYARLLPPALNAPQANTQIVINTGVDRSALADVELTTNAAHMYDDGLDNITDDDE